MRTLSLLSLLLVACGEPAATPDAGDHDAEKPADTKPEAPAEKMTTETPSDVAAPPADAKKTESGLAYKVLSSGGKSDHPDVTSRVTVHYTGWTTDGKKFDSSLDRKQPATFGLQQVIAGWTEGLQLMAPGDRFRFWIPEELAYRGQPNKPAGMLVFDVELLSYKTPPKAPEAPPDVAAAPADATKTASGLAYKVLKKGPGGDKPTTESMVTVHYAGWTTDGKNFDFSRKRGDNPASFGVGGVIPGWTEGLQLMETGDSYRFWIPPELAYEGKRGPQGTLVFDVDLLSVVNAPPMEPPTDAKSTESGLKYQLLSDPHPSGGTPPDGAKLQVNWVGWLAEGKRGFDSNLGRPPAHPMQQIRMLPGLKEAAYMLHEGEKARFWIPEELAFGGKPNTPKGMVIYDLELIGWDAPMPKDHP